MFIDNENRLELEAVLERAKICDIHTNTEHWPIETWPSQCKPMSDKRHMRCSKKWQRIRKERVSNFGHICPISLETEPLEVHHIDLDWSNNEPENLIPLWTPLHRLITARANYDEVYEARDRAILLSITKAWKIEP